MRSKLFFGCLTALVLAASAFAQEPAVLYDPLAKVPESGHTEADETIVKEKLVPKAAARWADDESCAGGNLSIIGALDGSFTAAGSRQRAIVYELCQTGNGFANNGVAVVEGGRVIVHFVEEGGWNLEVRKAPDINRNGRDELIIETGGGMHQGYTGSSVSVLELSPFAVVQLGVFLAYTNECESLAPNKYCDRSYRLTAVRGTRPAITSQKFLNRGTEERPRWVASGKPLPAKPIAGVENKYALVK